VLRYLPTNLSRPEIACELSVSLNTVNTHLRSIYAKLGVRDRDSAVQRARAGRLLGAGGPSAAGQAMAGGEVARKVTPRAVRNNDFLLSSERAVVRARGRAPCREPGRRGVAADSTRRMTIRGLPDRHRGAGSRSARHWDGRQRLCVTHC
jgi:Bacterial regulatory proteins, luxR family